MFIKASSMKGIFLTMPFILTMFFVVAAQTSEVVNALKPCPQNIKKNSKTSSITGGSVIDNNPLEFDVDGEFIDLPNDKKGFAVIIIMTNAQLVFAENGDKRQAQVNILTRLRAFDQSPNRLCAFPQDFFDDSFSIEVKTADSERWAKNPVPFRKVFALPAGRLKLDVVVRDVTSGLTGIRSLGFLNDAAK